MLRRLSERDHYEVLEVGYDASPEEIQNAYEEAREMYTHDALVSGSILSDQERRRTYECITAAYQTLIAEDSRRIYDEMIGVRSRKSVGRPRSDASPASSPSGTTPAPSAHEGELRTGGAGDASETASASNAVRATELSRPAPAPALAPAHRPPRRCTLELGATEEATGEFLRRARESVGLDLGTISQETKIGRSMLEYIEEERLDRLPAPVYLKNFTLQVAKCLGLDEERVARTYLARIRRLQSQSP